MESVINQYEYEMKCDEMNHLSNVNTGYIYRHTLMKIGESGLAKLLDAWEKVYIDIHFLIIIIYILYITIVTCTNVYCWRPGPWP